MKRIFSFIFFLSLSLSSLAQERSPEDERLIDSLKLALKTATHDTDKVNLRYLIGEQSWLFRVSYWDSLIADAHRLGMPRLEALATTNLGHIYKFEMNIPKALECFYKALEIFESINYKHGIAMVLLQIGQCYTISYNSEKSLDFNYRSLKIAEEIHDTTVIGMCMNNIAVTYVDQKDYEKALWLHLKTLKLFNDKGRKDNLGTVLFNIGEDYYQLKRNEEALSYLYAGVREAIESRDHVAEVMCYNKLGEVLEKKNDPQLAYYYYIKALGISRANKDNRGVANSLIHIARWANTMGNLKMARENAGEVLAMAQAKKHSMRIKDASFLLSEIYKKDRDFEKAFEMLELNLAVRDSITNEKTRKAAMEKQFAYDYGKKETENKQLTETNHSQVTELNRTKLFISGLGLLLIIILLAAFIIIRQNKLRAEQRSIQLEQKLLRSQMNPHFIFNSLQAIQNFILKNKDKEAVKYLSSFANVTRAVLENSRMDSIPLKKEISLLENYLQLQKLRFGNKFDFFISVEENIDTEHVNISPMLAQPFIENAIEHGMHDVESGGEISVSYALRKNSLLLEITDNGKGMGQSDSPAKQHRSLAMEITKERIELMNKKADQKVVFTITDAFPSNPERKGVKINFSIPLS